MKRALFFLFLLYGSATMVAQKPAIDSTVFGKWMSVGDVRINGNGKYVGYHIQDPKLGRDQFILEATDGQWRKEVGAGLFHFSSDGRQGYLALPGDTMAILTLGTDSVDYIAHVRSFSLLKNAGEEWLICSMSTGNSQYVLKNTRTGFSRIIENVVCISGENDKIKILAQTREVRAADTLFILKWVNLLSDSTHLVWTGGLSSDFIFDPSGTEVAFRMRKSAAILWYKFGGGPAQVLNEAQMIDTGKVELQNIRRFSKDGEKLFFMVKEKTFRRPLPNVPVTVWSYKDTMLQTLQETQMKPESYMAVLSLETKKCQQLNFENESVWSSSLLGQNDNIAVIHHLDSKIEYGERNWLPSATESDVLLELETNTRTPLLKGRVAEIQGVRLSPDERFVVYYDGKTKKFMSYEIKSRLFRNITNDIAVAWDANDREYPEEDLYGGAAFSAWCADGVHILLHDKFDFWVVDLFGKEAPINITNGYGRRHRIVFNLLGLDGSFPIAKGVKVTLVAFNEQSKDNGFYSITIGKRVDPDSLSMGPYFYFAPGNDLELKGMIPLKATDSSVYIVRRMSCSEAPNYFSTRDFRSFTRLTDIRPEKDYNWMTSELLTWKTFDGRVFQGVLYKPENFDPHKKYPVIFHYYEGKSDLKNAYFEPQPTSGPIDIPYFVSNGYLVVTPDIHYTVGKIGEGAVNAVVSAAEYLAKKPWVDGRAMAIQGKSFGGYETNYLVTHSHLFAAACAASGLSDMISTYGSLDAQGFSLQGMSETGQFRFGVPLSGHLETYVRNSPLFSAKDVSTPLLIMHNTHDVICPFEDAIQFFTLLRRLGKKVWLLQYDEGGHGVDGNSALDYTIRLQQFFDHYLKGAPEPIWMSRGIPARLKGIDNGLELDSGTK